MKKHLLTIALFLCGAFATQAQIAYHDINPDTTVNTWNAFEIAPPALAPGRLILWFHPTPEVVVQTMDNWEVLFNGTYPAKLNLNDSIAAGSGTWKAADYDALNSMGTGYWQTNATDKYLGFRVQTTTGYKYGWLKMSVAGGASAFTVKEYGYNTQTGKAIKAGQMATTGVSASLAEEQVQLLLAGRSIRLIHADPSARFDVAITDMAGHIVQRMQTYSDKPIALGDLSAGTYMLHVSVGGYTRVFKIGFE